MEFIQLSEHAHDVHIHDIAFDFYGKRFATCSTDSKIQIWSRDDIVEDSNARWTPVDITDCHNECIWRLSWAHPEFGSIIASCSEDRCVKIWEEQTSVTTSDKNNNKWLLKATLSDSKKAVNDVKFAPRHLGLKVATASADGVIRVYEASDVFSLNYWQLQYSFNPEMDVTQDNNPTSTSGHSEHGSTCLAWNDCVFEPPKIAVGGYSKRVSIWTFDSSDGSSGKWRQECDLLGDRADQQGVIQDVAWAPAMGRSYHLIALASRENHFKIHTLTRGSDGSLTYASTHTEPTLSPIWRVTWNATGTVLSTSSEDGSLSLWRRDFVGNWRSVQDLPGVTDTKQFYTN